MADAPVKQAPIPNSSTAAMLLELRAIRQTLDELKELFVARAAPVTNGTSDGSLVIVMEEPPAPALPVAAMVPARTTGKKANRAKKSGKKG